jgi:tripartite-type tricarboxylate transporter receptor subunit TctC
MAVPNSSPSKSVPEFIARAKAEPGKVTYCSSGIGTTLHLAGELFKRMAGIDVTHIPYRGAGPALNDLIPGRVDAIFANFPSTLPYVQNGQLRGLAVTTA